MKKICYITTIPVTIEAFFVEQMKYLAENGYEVYAICSPSKKLKNILGERIKYIPLEISRGISFFNLFYATYKLVRIFKKEKFQIVQYSTPNAAFVGAIASKLASIKIRNYHLMGLSMERKHRRN